jgi:branched-subunit amino acid ABC-type transport system permease component
MRSGEAGIAAMTGIAAAAAYLLLAGQASRTEFTAAAPVVLITAGFAVALHRTASRPMRLSSPALLVMAHALRSLLPDTVRVARALMWAIWKRPPGAIGPCIHQPFRHGSGSADDAGRRAAVTLGLSLAPNGYVLDLDGQADIPLHRLTPAGVAPDREWPS